MESQAPALPELEGVPAVPPLPQQAPEEHSTIQEGAALDIWKIEGTVNLDDAGICHKNAFYALLKEWFQRRDYTCTCISNKDITSLENWESFCSSSRFKGQAIEFPIQRH